MTAKKNGNSKHDKYSLNDLAFIVKGKSEYLDDLIDKDNKKEKQNGSMGKRRSGK